MAYSKKISTPPSARSAADQSAWLDKTMPEHLQLPRLMTFRDIQAFYRFSKSKTCLLISSGHLRAIKCGGQTLVPIEELEGFVGSLPAAALNFKGHGKPVFPSRQQKTRRQEIAASP